MSELPVGWMQVPLGDLADFEMGQAPSAKDCNTDGVGTIFVKAGEFGKLKPVVREWTTRPLKYAQDGDILICVVGATAGKINLGIDCAIGRSVAAVRPAHEISQKFIYYFLAGKVQSLRQGSTGSAQGVISKPDIAAISIPMAPAAEQTRIAAKLDELLAQVDTLKARIDGIPALLKRFRQSVLAAAVSGRLTEEWRSTNHASDPFSPELFAKAIQDSGFKSKAKKLRKPIESEISGWINAQLGSVFSVRSGDGLTAKEMDNSEIFPVYGGNGVNGTHSAANVFTRTVVIGRVGYYCGSVHLTPEKAWITDNALIVSYPKELIESEYAYWLLRGTDLRKNTSSTAQPVISGEKIYPIEINIPPLQEQTEIVRRVEQLFAFADQLEAKVNEARTRIDRLTQSILAKAFRGELVPQDPDDEPASVLLERIQAQRASAPKARRGRRKAESA